MKKYLVCIILTLGLFGSSAAVAASPEPTSEKCLKFKKEALSDESKMKQLYKRYDPAAGKKGSSYSESKFKSYFSKLEDYNDFAIKAYKNMSKNPKCFSKKELDVVKRYLDTQERFKKNISKDAILQGKFPVFEMMSVYGGKL
jgi:exonuclease V gamma subunit